MSHIHSSGRIPPDLLGDLLPVLRGRQAGRPLPGGNGSACLSGGLRRLGPLPDGVSFGGRRKADGLFLQSLLLHLPHPYFLLADVRAVGPPGRRRPCAADGSADLRADNRVLLRRVRGPVPGSVCPPLADIEDTRRTGPAAGLLHRILRKRRAAMRPKNPPEIKNLKHRSLAEICLPGAGLVFAGGSPRAAFSSKNAKDYNRHCTASLFGRSGPCAQ